LFDHVYKLDHLPENEAAHYMAQLASFLAYAHSKNIIHRCVVGGGAEAEVW
jgi:serine/threonine protein kinase